MTRKDRTQLARKFLEFNNLEDAAEAAGWNVNDPNILAKIRRWGKTASFSEDLAQEGRAQYLRTLWQASQGKATAVAVKASRALALAAGAKPSELPGFKGKSDAKAMESKDKTPPPSSSEALEW